MNILVNASILKVGGSVQVGDSIIRELPRFSQHKFIIVYANPSLKDAVNYAATFPNCKVVSYAIPKFYIGTLTGYNCYLDRLVKNEKIESVLTIFGPSRWRPRVFHLCGFARPHLVITDSPYLQNASLLGKIKDKVLYKAIEWSYKMSCDAIFTENPAIAKGLQERMPAKQVFTVTGSYNQVYEHPELWDRSISLPPFSGTTILTIAANYPHKNLKIILPTIDYLKQKYPEFMFRFIISIKPDEFPDLTDDQKKHIVFVGSLKISQCPPLYEQSDIMLLPTLMESFSSCYPDAMFMKKPILTTDLSFAHGTCGEAAMYYSPLSSESLAESLYQLANNDAACRKLVECGTTQLNQFDNFQQRIDKLISILENNCIDSYADE